MRLHGVRGSFRVGMSGDLFDTIEPALPNLGRGPRLAPTRASLMSVAAVPPEVAERARSAIDRMVAIT